MFNEQHYKILREKVDALPRVNLADLPTPLHEVPSLSEELGPRIFFKRDDLTGLALGGNKTRMLEFRLIHALEEGADAVVTGYGVQSNHARQTAAACSKLGLECHLVLTGDGSDSYYPQGNLLLDEVLGANVTIINGSTAEQKKLIEQTAADLQDEGKNAFITGVEDYDLSAVAYVDGMLEIANQLKTEGVNPDYVFVSSEGSTQAGLEVAAKYLELEPEIVGITPMKQISKPWRKTDITAEISRIANVVIDRFELDISIERNEITNLSQYVGKGYGIGTEEGRESIELVARKEGILLDPCYTGKAMAGLLDQIRSGRVSSDDTVLFLHTGGFPLIFAYSDFLGQPIRPYGKNIS